MKILFLTILSFVLTALLFAQSTHSAYALTQSQRPMQLFTDGSEVFGSWSRLIRYNDGVYMSVRTTQLPMRSADTVWWVIFNNPENCSHGTGGFRCGEGDLADPSIEPSILYATGQVIGGGVGSFTASLAMNDTSGCVNTLPCNDGLTNPMGADIHLIVRSHGPMLTDLYQEQISTFGGGCNNVPEGTGTPGPNTCVDLQFSVHEVL